MRVALVSLEKSQVRVPNLPLGYLAATLRAKGHDVAVLDLGQRGRTLEGIRDLLSTGGFGLVGFQAYSCSYPHSRAMARAVKAASPASHVVLGGRHASALPAEVLAEEPAVDSVLSGEAEDTLPALVAALEGDGSLADVPGLYSRGADGAVVTGPAAMLPDLDALPLPAWDLVSPSLYPIGPPGTFVQAFPTAPLLTSRGCAYRCRFCAAGVSSGRIVRFRSPDAVIEEVRHLVRRHGVREIQIMDDNFTLRRAHALAICEALARDDLRVALSVPNGLRLDTLDRELIQALERAGCYSATVGIDSGSDRVLASMDRGIDLARMEQAVRLIKETSRIRLTANFILGLPGETPEDLEKTIRYALHLPLDRAYFGLYMPLPGSALFDELRAAGRLDGMAWGDLSPVARGMSYVPDGMTAGELRRFLWRAYASFYLRPRVLRGLAGEVRSTEHALWMVAKMAGRLLGTEGRG